MDLRISRKQIPDSRSASVRKRSDAPATTMSLTLNLLLYGALFWLAFSATWTNPAFVAVIAATIGSLTSVLAAKTSWKMLPATRGGRKGPLLVSLASTLTANLAMGYFVANKLYDQWRTSDLEQSPITDDTRRRGFSEPLVERFVGTERIAVGRHHRVVVLALGRMVGIAITQLNFRSRSRSGQHGRQPRRTFEPLAPLAATRRQSAQQQARRRGLDHPERLLDRLEGRGRQTRQIVTATPHSRGPAGRRSGQHGRQPRRTFEPLAPLAATRRQSAQQLARRGGPDRAGRPADRGGGRCRQARRLGVATQAMATPSPPHGIRAVDQPEHLARQAHGAAHGGFQQPLASPLEMPQALLMCGGSKLVILAPAVMHQSPRPVRSQQLLQRLAAPRRIDDITGFSFGRDAVQPSRPTGYAPAGFVGHGLGRTANVLSQLLVGRFATLGRAGDRSCAGASHDRQILEQGSQQFHAFAVRQAQLLVHDRERGVDVRAELIGRRAAGRRGLQFMAALHDMTTMIAHADMHVELAIDDGAGNFSLILRIDVSFADLVVAAVRTWLRHRHVVGLVDPRRHGALAMPPMAASRLAARLFRLGDRFVVLPKRSRLTLGSAAQFLDLQQQLLNSRLETNVFRDHLRVARPREPRLRDRVFLHSSRPYWLYDENPASSLASIPHFVGTVGKQLPVLIDPKHRLRSIILPASPKEPAEARVITPKPTALLTRQGFFNIWPHLLTVNPRGNSMTRLQANSRPSAIWIVAHSAILLAVLSRTVLADDPPGTAPDAGDAQDKWQYSLFNPVPADQLRDMDTDRPNKTNTPHTIDAGHLQIETGIVDFSTYRDYYQGANARDETLGLGQFNFRLGVLNNLELNAVVNAFESEWNTDYLANQFTRQNGLGDTVFGGKLNLWGNDGADDTWATGLAIQPQLKLATARTGLGNGHAEMFLGIPFVMNLPEKFHLGLQLTVGWQRNSTNTADVTGWQNSASLDRAIFDDKLDLYLEYWSEATTEQHQEAQQTLDVGGTYKVGKNMILDTGVNFGLNHASANVEWVAGISVRF